MTVATLSSKGQVTLPARFRRMIGIEPNDRVVIETEGDAIVIRRAADFFELAGFLGKALPVTKESEGKMRGAAARSKGTKA